MMRTFNGGVLFCGGCNPRYDRLQLFEQVQQEMPEIHFFFYEKGMDCDFILLINGCGSECLLNENFPCPVALVRSGDLEEACTSVKRCISGI